MEERENTIQRTVPVYTENDKRLLLASLYNVIDIAMISNIRPRIGDNPAKSGVSGRFVVTIEFYPDEEGEDD
jgi:hypothetical protein